MLPLAHAPSLPRCVQPAIAQLIIALQLRRAMVLLQVSYVARELDQQCKTVSTQSKMPRLLQHDITGRHGIPHHD